MGKNWFSVLKKAFLLVSRGKKNKNHQRWSKKWFGKGKTPDSARINEQKVVASVSSPPPPPPPPPPTSASAQPSLTPTPIQSSQPQWPALPSFEDARLNESSDDQSRHAYSVAIATAVAAEAAVVAAQAAAEVVRLTSSVRPAGSSEEEDAAIRIQCAYRGYMARRTLRALKGLNKLKTFVESQSVIRQSEKTLHCMQTLSRMQYQIRERRIRMSEDKFASYNQNLQQNHDEESDDKKNSIGDEWNASTQSKEEIEVRLLKKKEAAQRRKRALAYAHTHQQTWRHPSKQEHQTFTNPHDLHWGWSWLEHWMSLRSWESPDATAKKAKHNTVKFSVTSVEPAPPASSVGESKKKPRPRAEMTITKSKSARRATGRQEESTSLSTEPGPLLQRRLSSCSLESVESSPLPKKSFLIPKETAKSRARKLANRRRLSFSEPVAVSPSSRRISAAPRVDCRRTHVSLDGSSVR